MNKVIISIAVAVVIISISAYALSPYFTESSINEALPDNVITQSMEEEITQDEQMEETQKETMTEKETMEDETQKETMEDETQKETMTEKETMIQDEETQEIARLYEGTFVGVGDGIHDAQGIAKIIPLQDGSEILRLEEFRSTNGPDLYVYLATDKHASDFISLGKLKANQGNQNYVMPDDVDLEKYNQVLIWCKPFSVLFGNAELNPQ